MKLADVAKRAGMSPTAVSLVLNDRPGARLSDEAAERIRAAARELGYRPNQAARSLRMGKTATVGFISDDVTVTRYASAMIRGALDVAEELDHTVLMAETGSRPQSRDRAVAAMLDRRPDALIFALMGAKLIDLPEVPSDLPVVMLNGMSPDGRSSVLPAEFDAGHAVTNLLLAQGHRDIVIMGDAPELRSNPRKSVTVGDRYAGIDSALADAGVTPLMRLPGEQWLPGLGYDLMDEWLDAGIPFSALICLNDNLAFGAYQALKERGLRVPRDVSVVSFDDDVVASYLRPGLTTAAIPYEEMGRQAMAMALSPTPVTEHRLVPMPLRIRESIGEAAM